MKGRNDLEGNDHRFRMKDDAAVIFLIDGWPALRFSIFNIFTIENIAVGRVKPDQVGRSVGSCWESCTSIELNL
jgi:hypothetical protein